MCILASTNSTYQFPIQRAKPGFGEAELRMFAQSIAFDLSDIVAGFKLGPQQFVASAVRFLQREVCWT